MAAMVLQINSLSQDALEPFDIFGRWAWCEMRPRQQEGGAAIGTTARQTATMAHTQSNRASTCASPGNENGCPREGDNPNNTSNSAIASSDPSSPTSVSPRPGTVSLNILATSLSSFTFTQVITPVDTFSFGSTSASGLVDPSYRPGKRSRDGSDVDGPNTASLSCKKRRLRRHLITSRLSQPFSLPATHILNREAAAAGDKRFLKLAAITNARKLVGAHTHPYNSTPLTIQSSSNPAGNAISGTSPGQGISSAAVMPGMPPCPSEMLRRAAIINRFRLRAYRAAASRGHPALAQVAGNAGVLQLSQGLGIVSGARFPGMSTQGVGVPPVPTAIPQPQHPHPLSRAAAVARNSPPGSPKGLRPVDDSNVCSVRVSALPARERALEANEVDDDECAFPMSEHASQYDDDPDDVYADFSVIFGGGSDVDEDEDREGYEAYMDDLDGIPYGAR